MYFILFKGYIFKEQNAASFFDKCFKTFLNNMFLRTPKVLTAETKTWALVFPSLGELPL